MSLVENKLDKCIKALQLTMGVNIYLSNSKGIVIKWKS
jgi:hypothetical protein